MKKAILHISGDVRQSGFRAKIVDIAKALDIKGYVANLVTFLFILEKWIVVKNIHRRGRREAQRFVVFLCVPLRSLRFSE